MNRTLPILIVILTLLVACGGETTPTPGTVSETPTELTLMTHDSFAISEDVLAQFEGEHNAKINLLPAGDAGAALNQAILSKDNPLADVFFGVDNTFLSRALEADIFDSYQSPVLASIPDQLELDSSYRLLPMDYGDVCLNYDKEWFSEHDTPLPQELGDLADSAYAGLTVVENPATSSPGLAFLLATIANFGTDGQYTYLDFWGEMRSNDVLVSDGWENAYYGEFSATGEGTRPLVVSYASSPPAEVVFAEPPVEEPPTGSVTAPGTCYRQIEFVGILKGTSYRALAEALVDFMLSQTFQEDIPLNMFVFPANEDAALPEVFVKWAQIPDSPASLPPDVIDANREQWIEAWTEVVLR